MFPKRYHFSLRILHWTIAALILTALVLGTFVMAPADPTDPAKAFALLKHMLAGGLILLLTLTRLFVRPITRRPPPALSGIEAADRMIPLVHRAFDVMALVMVVSGIVLAVLNQLHVQVPDIVFSGQGHLPGHYHGHPIHVLHIGIARLLAAIVMLHVAGALYHHFILRDGLFSRMTLIPRRYKA